MPFGNVSEMENDGSGWSLLFFIRSLILLFDFLILHIYFFYIKIKRVYCPNKSFHELVLKISMYYYLDLKLQRMISC